MKINSIERIKFVNELVGYFEPPDGSGKEPHFEPKEVSREKITKYDGIIVQELSQIEDLVRSLANPGSELILMPTERGMTLDLSKGGSFPVPNELTYMELRVFEGDERPLEDDENSASRYDWVVKLKVETTERKEQVSLTLSSLTLRMLREQASITKQSLSGVIDAKLEIILGLRNSEIEKDHRELIGDLEEVLQKAKKKISR